MYGNFRPINIFAIDTHFSMFNNRRQRFANKNNGSNRGRTEYKLRIYFHQTVFDEFSAERFARL